MSKPQENELDFEGAFRQLEETVQALDKGGLTLAEATKLYEQGMELVRTCSDQLDSAQLRITELQTAFTARVATEEEPQT